LGGNALVHWDGMSWSLDTSQDSSTLNAVWGSSADDVWAFAEKGDVLHLETGTWSSNSPSDGTGPSYATLQDVSGSGPNDAWAVGAAYSDVVSGTLLHFDGTDWTAASTNSNLQFTGIWANAANDLWVVASDGGVDTVLRWNGTAFSESYAGPTRYGIRKVWASGPNDAWAFGGNPRASEHGVLHWDGQQWSSVPMDVIFTDLWGSGPDDVWAVEGSRVWHYDGQSWAIFEDCAGLFTSVYLNGVWASGPNDVWAIGSNDLSSSIILRWNGSAWSAKTNLGTTLSQVWGSIRGDVWFAGSRTVLHWDSVQWQSIPTGTQREITGLWGTSSDNVWAVGNDGMILHH
jgi:hypothetical protein